MANVETVRQDPIGDRYYKPLERAEKTSDILFYIAAALSFIVLMFERASSPILYSVVHIAFVISVLLVFALGMAIRLYWKPRAEDKRRSESISNATGIALTVEHTEGYYNNEQAEPIKRLALIVLENSHFTKAIALEMLRFERLKVLVYAVLFVLFLLIREAELALAATAAQAVFSEQIISKWLRLEWLQRRAEQTFNNAYAMIQGKPSRPVMLARVIELFSFYEVSKANAAVALSSKIFELRNEDLSAEWEKIKGRLQV